MGGSAGGVGIHGTRDWSLEDRWQLRGSRLPDEQNLYTKVEWAWKADKLNEQSELRRAFELALVLLHPEPCIKVTAAIRGQLLQKRWRHFTIFTPKDPPKVSELELYPEYVELSSTVETLETDIVRLNARLVQEDTINSALAEGTAAPASVEEPSEGLVNTLVSSVPQLFAS